MTLPERLVWETEGRRGAAERGWLGESERLREEARQREEWERYEREREALASNTRNHEEVGRLRADPRLTLTKDDLYLLVEWSGRDLGAWPSNEDVYAARKRVYAAAAAMEEEQT